MGKKLAMTVDGAGDGETVGSLQAVVDDVCVITKVPTNDAASVNNCITRSEKDAMIATRRRLRLARPGAQTYRSHLDIRCYAHQACLLTRPVVTQAGDTVSTLQRLGHIQQSARSSAVFLAKLDASVTAIFKFARVNVLPAGTALHAEHARVVMSSSAACMSLSPAEVDYIIGHDNCCWSNVDEYNHFCLGPDQCIPGCKDAADSLQIAKAGVRLSIGRGMNQALIYRWKDVDMALAYGCRGRGQHDLLFRMLRAMWPADQVEDANRN